VQPLRIATVPYLNAAPLVWGLGARGAASGFRVEILPLRPSRIAGLLASGGADVGLVPVAELPGLGSTELVGGLGIASRRRARSVLLVSRRPFGEARRIALDASSRTSAALVRLLLKARGLDGLEFVERAPEWPAMLDDADAALVIGDPALTADLSGCEVIDLATEWHAATGLPFVFAVWAARPGFVLPDAGRMFHDAYRDGAARIDDLARDAAGRLQRPAAELAAYLRECIHYCLGPDEERAIPLFLARAHEIGLVPRPAALRWRREAAAAAVAGGIA
jgi:chorismate dehydratase